jgi:undecaprenyl diphosphate synthase
VHIPRCLVIIPDGNRRWAQAHHRPGKLGHTQGLVNCRSIARTAFERGVEHLVFWAASEANLRNRSPEEISHLFRLLKHELRRRSRRNEKVGFHLCGSWNDPELTELAWAVENETTRYQQHMTVLFGYNGRSEILAATQALLRSGEPATNDSFRRHLWTAHVPEVDLLIRTGTHSDPHLSDSLLPWQLQNSQLHFSEACWPDFGTQQLLRAFSDFEARPRRRGV